MSFIDNLRSNLGFKTASALAPVAPPKVSAGQVANPSWAKTSTPTTARLMDPDVRASQSDLTLARTEATDALTIRKFAETSPDLSATLFTYLRVAIAQNYKIKAYSLDGVFDEDATRAGYNLLSRWDMLPDYTSQGFSNTPSIRSLSEALGKELIIEGAYAFELRLNKQRLPELLVPIAVSQIKWYQDGQGLRPVQLVAGTEFDLDIPTFFYGSLDQDLLSPYAKSPLKAAIQPVTADAQYMRDLRRGMNRALLPRFTSTIDLEKTMAMLPPAIKADPDKLAAKLQEIKSGIEDTVNSLDPESAIVGFSNTSFEYMKGGTGEASSLLSTVQDLLNAKLSTGAKTLPSIIGHGGGSQNIASSETMMFLKAADGAVRRPLNEGYSRALTLGVRLLGFDVKVVFEYDEIELRPVTELEAFFAQRQSRILEQLSLGLITDGEAAIELTGKLPSVPTKLSGTQFMATTKADPTANNYTNAPGGLTDSTLGNATKSKAPTNTRAGNK